MTHSGFAAHLGSAVHPGTVTIGFSGGVDSTVAALLMKERFRYAVAATMWLYEGQEQSFDRLKASCESLGIPHRILDFRKAFESEVVKKYLRYYESGLTPNPCIFCNRSIKYGLFLDAVDTDYLALGHYARKVAVDGEFRLFRSYANRKDQSYYLYSLSQEQLRRVLFPIGEFHDKSEVKAYFEAYVGSRRNAESRCEAELRRNAESRCEAELRRNAESCSAAASVQRIDTNSVSAPCGESAAQEAEHRYAAPARIEAESMGACFLKGEKRDDFLKTMGIPTSRRGFFVDKKGMILGEHDGISKYTPGQKPRIRKKEVVDGMTSPYFVPGVVCGFNLEKNEVLIGEEADIHKSTIEVSEIGIVSPSRRREMIAGLKVQARLSQWSEVYEGDCRIEERCDANRGIEEYIVFETSEGTQMRAPAPGQAAVFYIGDELIGGGIIV